MKMHITTARFPLLMDDVMVMRSPPAPATIADPTPQHRPMLGRSVALALTTSNLVCIAVIQGSSTGRYDV